MLNFKCSKGKLYKKEIHYFQIDGFSSLYLAFYKCAQVTLYAVRKIKLCTKETSLKVL